MTVLSLYIILEKGVCKLTKHNESFVLFVKRIRSIDCKGM